MAHIELPFSIVSDTDLRLLFAEGPKSFDLNNMIFDPLRGQRSSIIVEEDDLDMFLSNECQISIPEAKYISEVSEIKTDSSLFNLMFLNIRS